MPALWRKAFRIMPESMTMLAHSHWQASGKICSLALAASCVPQHHQSMLSLFAASRIELSSPQINIEMGST
jgi:hypothetical protein